MTHPNPSLTVLEVGIDSELLVLNRTGRWWKMVTPIHASCNLKRSGGLVSRNGDGASNWWIETDRNGDALRYPFPGLDLRRAESGLARHRPVLIGDDTANLRSQGHDNVRELLQFFFFNRGC